MGKSKEDSRTAPGVLDATLLLPPSSAKQIIAETGNEVKQYAYSVAIATAFADEAAAAAARVASEIVCLMGSLTSVGGSSREEIAAIKIQIAFRDYLARRGSCPIRGINRLKSLTTTNAVKCQTMNSLRSVQTLAKLPLFRHRSVQAESDCLKKTRFFTENWSLSERKNLRN